MHYEAGQTLNDFVYLGPIKFQDYLNQLHTYSKSLEGHTIAVSKDGKVLPQLQLKENFDYCGT
jgi:hypothetical protein